MTDTRTAVDHDYAECSYQERETGAWVACPVCENYATREEWAEDNYADPDAFFTPPDPEPPVDWDYSPW